MTLEIDNGKVVAERRGEFPAKFEVGSYRPAGKLRIPNDEATLAVFNTPDGWQATLSAFLPPEFDFFAPELRLRLFSPRGKQAVIDDRYISLGSINVGRIFNTRSEFAEISSSGEHSYVVRTSVWLLNGDGVVKHVLDVPGLLISIRTAIGSLEGGLMIDRETYDGVNSETKGFKPEFWRWTEKSQSFTLEPQR